MWLHDHDMKGLLFEDALQACSAHIRFSWIILLVLFALQAACYRAQALNGCACSPPVLPSIRIPQTPVMYTALQRVRYDPALALIVDIRTVLPGSGATAPVGWAALPIFESGPGRYVASGYYQLPLFQVSSCLATMQHCCLWDLRSACCTGCDEVVHFPIVSCTAQDICTVPGPGRPN